MTAVPVPPILRVPTLEDGPGIHALVAQCPPLDTNSRYCNLLQCHHFADTSIVASLGQHLIGALLCGDQYFSGAPKSPPN